MPARVKTPEFPVEIVHDGTRVVAERGEPLAFALIAADRLPLARSPKLHRPRGPYCLRGGCDGCLARVDGEPNVMTCLRRARGGEQIETQNVLGTRGVDALRAADFLFPRGIDHHRLFAGIRGVSGVVQSFARRVAGLGKLPSEAELPRGAQRRELDVLVIGGGASGLSALAELPRGAVLVDDAPSLGGADRALDPSRARQLVALASSRGGELRAETTAIALLREPERPDGRLSALTLGPEGATLFVARAVILASGRHDPVLAFGDNDLPGVYSARAALALWRGGVGLGKRVALLDGGPAAERFAGEAGGAVEVLCAGGTDVVRAVGRSKVSGVVLRTAAGERRMPVDAILIGGAGSPALELAIQAGASAEPDALAGYRLCADAEGRLGPGLFATGSLLGHADSAAAGRKTGVLVRGALGLG